MKKKFYLAILAFAVCVSAWGAAWADLSKEGGEKMMKALAKAYPEKIECVEYRNGDWAVLMEGKWYFYADNRLLPEELLPRKERYSPQSYYEYFSDLPEWQPLEGEAAERMKNIYKDRLKNPPNRDPSFFDTIWSARDSKEARNNLVPINFLGRRVQVHKYLAERFTKVDALIRAAAENDPALKIWINDIGSVSAWNWRNIAATVSRSFHAYAAALDILPKNHSKMHTYWLWSAEINEEWYNIPYNNRWFPPESVVKAFEAYGFCWGGKWRLYDAMHFEYRPEIMILSGMPFENGGKITDNNEAMSYPSESTPPSISAEEWEAFLTRIKKNVGEKNIKKR